MKLDLKQPELSIRNEYTLQLFDEDNNLLQEVKCHNAASSKKFIDYYILGDTYYVYIILGTGIGTINIENADEKIFKLAFGSNSYNGFSRISTEPTFNNIHYRGTITFPAKTQYVGDLTEIALSGQYQGSSKVFSHSLLMDAEGNPIVIKKTSTNMLIVTIDLFFSVNLPEQPYNFKYFPAWCSILAGKRFKNSSYYIDGITIDDDVAGAYVPWTFFKYAKLSTYYCGTETDSQGILKYPVPAPFGTSISFTRPDQASPATVSINTRWDSGNNNISFAHSIVFSGIGVIPLPNHDICPPYEYKNIDVGVGDGTTYTFLPYINEVVSAIGYVNGTQTNSSFQNFDPRKSPLWNKCIKMRRYTSQNAAEEYEVPSYSYQKYSSSDPSAEFLNYSLAILSEKPLSYNTPFISSYYGIDYIYYSEEGITLDHIRAGAVRTVNNSYYYYREDVNIIISYSDDGINWTQIFTLTEAYKTNYFSRTKAKYWKLYFGKTNYYNETIVATFSTKAQWNKNTSTAYGLDPKYIVAGDSQEFDFGKCGITFETPPPEGAVITMDAILDLPYKDTDIVMTMSVEVEQPDPNEVTV